MIEKIRDFCSEHKLIVIGGLLYIAVYVASNMYSPWVAEELNASAEELPPDFLFFGIYELLTMILYAINEISDSLLSQVMFMVTVSAMFTYVHFIIEKIFDIGFYDEEGLSKKSADISLTIFLRISCACLVINFSCLPGRTYTNSIPVRELCTE